MTVICQNCHPATSVATIHGNIDSKQGCYNCHKGTSTLNGSEIPHTIHVGKATCQDCHQDNGKIVVPQCQKCHKIDELHAFNKIGTKTTNLKCQICHPETAKTSQEVNSTQPSQTDAVPTGGNVASVSVTPITTTNAEEAQGLPKAPTVPGFGIISGIVALCLVIRRIRK
jgi:hypothetical protein